VSLTFFAGAAVLYIVSLVDDFRPLSAAVRFGIQFAAAGAAVAAIGFEFGVVQVEPFRFCGVNFQPVAALGMGFELGGVSAAEMLATRYPLLATVRHAGGRALGSIAGASRTGSCHDS
jgi:UDP-N-acetylmuramyl pentapeptide phosphotransferase/UDP-N-acetylglucosamine-1-phosphate transferase